MNAIRIVLAALAAVVLVIVLCFGWPGYFAHSVCPETQGVVSVFDERDYCSKTLDGLPTSQGYPYFTNQSFAGFTFEIALEVSENYGGWGAFVIASIVEPNGSSFHGEIPYYGVEHNVTEMWFVPGNDSGVSTITNSGTVTLLVLP